MAQAPKGGKGMGSKQPAGLPKGKVGNVKSGDKLQHKPKQKY
jgi:hypothetical protein